MGLVRSGQLRPLRTFPRFHARDIKAWVSISRVSAANGSRPRPHRPPLFCPPTPASATRAHCRRLVAFRLGPPADSQPGMDRFHGLAAPRFQSPEQPFLSSPLAPPRADQPTAGAIAPSTMWTCVSWASELWSLRTCAKSVLQSPPQRRSDAPVSPQPARLPLVLSRLPLTHRRPGNNMSQSTNVLIYAARPSPRLSLWSAVMGTWRGLDIHIICHTSHIVWPHSRRSVPFSSFAPRSS